MSAPHKKYRVGELRPSQLLFTYGIGAIVDEEQALAVSRSRHAEQINRLRPEPGPRLYDGHRGAISIALPLLPLTAIRSPLGVTVRPSGPLSASPPVRTPVPEPAGGFLVIAFGMAMGQGGVPDPAPAVEGQVCGSWQLVPRCGGRGRVGHTGTSRRPGCVRGTSVAAASGAEAAAR